MFLFSFLKYSAQDGACVTTGDGGWVIGGGDGFGVSGNSKYPGQEGGWVIGGGDGCGLKIRFRVHFNKYILQV